MDHLMLRIKLLSPIETAFDNPQNQNRTLTPPKNENE